MPLHVWGSLGVAGLWVTEGLLNETSLDGVTESHAGAEGVLNPMREKTS